PISLITERTSAKSRLMRPGKAMMGTGEADGENRAKEAAEQAIANPLLDGVSMQGAKGVIISIIGGEDMKLFEVDGAANHIRELVDEDANIIWGSAFNPDLEGKIRVSVVATGIEQDAQAQPAGTVSPAALASARAPKRPVLDLTGEAETPVADDPPAPAIKLEPPVVPAPEPEPEPEPEASPEPLFQSDPEPPAVPEPYSEPETSSAAVPKPFFEATPRIPTPKPPKPTPIFADPVTEAQEADQEEFDDPAKPFDLTGMQAGDDMGEQDEDVDDIVDPLAGLRGADDEPYDLSNAEADAALPASEEDNRFASLAPGAKRGGIGSKPLDADYAEIGEQEAEAEAQAEYEADASTDDILADADRLNAQNKPVEARLGGGRRRSAPAAGADETASGGGSTLFERMANLSRSSGSDDEYDEDDDDDAPALSIPRFLGRQNNQ
ncbi:MAG: hypothetical protein AAFR88_01895, partial [Pseudomonadota bacterium]